MVVEREVRPQAGGGDLRRRGPRRRSPGSPARRPAEPSLTLTQVELRLRVQECSTPDRCDTVGDTTETIFVNVPPQQTREINDSIYFPDIGRPRMTRTWSYDLVSVSADPPAR